MKKRFLVMFFLFAFCGADVNAQVNQTLVLQNGAVLKRTSSFAVVAEPCKPIQKAFAVPVDSSALDTSYVTTIWPAGIDIQLINALGEVSVTNVSITANALNFTLRATGDGTLVSHTSGTGTTMVCAGAQSAYIEVAVIAHYRSVAASSATYAAPKPDIRLAFDFSLLKNAAASFDNYKLGEWIRLGEFGCGDRTMFDAHIKDPPVLSATGYLNSDGSYGTMLNLSATARAQIHGCLADQWADGQAYAATTVGPFGGGSLPINGSATINLANVVNRTFPFGFTVPIPSFSSLPVDLPPVPGATLEFGTFDGSNFAPSPTPTHKDIPIAINVGSFGGSPGDNSTLIVDATVGQSQIAAFTTANDATSYFNSDQPLWNQRNLGVTVHDTFFGNAGSGKPSTGLLGSLLPIRISGDTIGSFKKHFEIVFDGATVKFVKHNGGDAISVSLSTTYAKIGNGKPLVGHGKPLSQIKATVLLDRIVAEDGALKFRVADFRVAISSWFLIFPIKLSSGQLEQSLNNGLIPLTGILNLEIDLPVCINTGSDKFISGPNTCNPVPWIGYLGYFSGPRIATFTIDPTTIITRFNQFAVGGQKWQGLQAGIQVH